MPSRQRGKPLQWRGLILAAAVGVVAAGHAAFAAPARVDAIPLHAPGGLRIRGASAPDAAAVWAGVPPVGDFVERDPAEGATPSQRTEFQVGFDATTLFVRVRAFDTEPQKIVGYLTRRDADSPSDWVRVLVDSYHDRRTAYEFAVNPAGVKIDRYWYDDLKQDDSWDAVWDVSVGRDALGWVADFRIPFSQLRFTPRDSMTFGFAVSRQIGRLNETSTWPLLPRSANGYVSSFGEVSGLTLAAAPKRLEMMPYAVADLTRQSPAGNPLLKRAAPAGAAGLDMKYALTPGLTMTATVNPDFGQVEADPAVVNLTAFETFFAERRPFFVEGSGNFQFDVDCNDGSCTGLFYSRRIGRTPQGSANLPEGAAVFTDAPAQASIVGAAKLTGRVGAYSVGAVEAVTREAYATVVDGPLRYEQPVEPLTSYSAARVRRQFADQSSFGLVLTSTNRRSAAGLSVLPDAAYTGGVDWDWRIARQYAITGYVAGSTVRGGVEAIQDLQQNSRHYFQRPGAPVQYDPAATSLSGASGRLGISKIGGQRVRFTSTLAFKSPGFDINDVGFFRRADTRSMNNWLQIRSDVPTRWFRSRMINFNQWAAWNFSGDRLTSGGNVNAHARFVNNWRIGAGLNAGAVGFDDRLTRGGPGGLVDGFTEAWYYANSDDRRALSVTYNGAIGGDAHGSRFVEHEPSITLRPTPPLAISTGVRIARNIIDAQWVDAITEPSTHYVFAHLDQTTVALTARVNYTISPRLSLQLYAQPFVSGGDYTGYKELVNGRATDYEHRFAPYGYSTEVNGNPDFNVKSFRTTNVLRWEYKPGSTLFVVWQQARENDAVPGGFRFARDVHDIFGVPARNVFLVKLAYWLNY